MPDKFINKDLSAIEVLHDKAFYGFKYDSNGDGSVNIMRVGDSSPVVLPAHTFDANGNPKLDSSQVIEPFGYKEWFWAKDALTFRMNNSNGHLEMVIL